MDNIRSMISMRKGRLSDYDLLDPNYKPYKEWVLKANPQWMSAAIKWGRGDWGHNHYGPLKRAGRYDLITDRDEYAKDFAERLFEKKLREIGMSPIKFPKYAGNLWVDENKMRDYARSQGADFLRNCKTIAKPFIIPISDEYNMIYDAPTDKVYTREDYWKDILPLRRKNSSTDEEEEQ